MQSRCQAMSEIFQMRFSQGSWLETGRLMIYHGLHHAHVQGLTYCENKKMLLTVICQRVQIHCSVANRAKFIDSLVKDL